MTPRFTEPQLVQLSGMAIGKINGRGRRGTCMVTHEEIEAMAGLLLLMGVPEIVAAPASDRSPFSPVKE